MGGTEAPVAPEDSAAGIWEQIEALSRSRSGSFIDFQGQALPW
jgi:hypothetical protein